MAFNYISIEMKKVDLANIETRVFKRLLEASKVPSQADETDPYGKYLFAPNRKDLKRTAAAKEKNTPEENDLFKAFADHYNNKGYTLGKFAPGLLDLMAQGKYAKLLNPPPGPYYRVIDELDPKFLASFLGVREEDIVPNVLTMGGPGRMTPGGRMAGKTGIHSWTVDPGGEWLLQDIIYGKMNVGTCLVILRASRGQFFVDPTGMSNVTNMSKYVETQGEVISYGPIDFDECCYYYHPLGNIKFVLKSDKVDEMIPMITL